MCRLLACLSRWMIGCLAAAALAATVAPQRASGAIPAASKTIDDIPTVVAVADFGGDDAKLRQDIRDLFTADLAKSKRLTLVERSQLEKVVAEQRLDESGLVDPTKAAEVGKLVGAGKIIVGGFNRIGSRVSLNARLVDVTTGRIVAGGAEQIEGKIEGEGEDIFGLVHQLATRFHRAITGEWLPDVPLVSRDGLSLASRIDPLALLDRGDSGIRMEVKLERKKAGSGGWVEVRLDRKGESTYRWGETMRISFRVDTPCYVYLFNIDTARLVSQLYPYPGDARPEEQIQPGRWYHIPGDRDEWELEITGEVGEEEIVAVASSRPLGLGKQADGATGGKGAAEFAGKTVVPKLRETPSAWAGKRLRFYTTK